MGTNTIVLAVNGERVHVPQSYSPSHRLIDVLRSETRFTGPKVGCGEGGCGACTVLIDRFDPVTGAVSRASINSCLATIGSSDGASITTAEGLGNSKCGFHPVQEALAKHFASQCGYCTPGITVALAAAAQRAAAEPAAAAVEAGASGLTRAAAIAAGLDGNLCRCTGWRPIIDVVQEIADLEDLHTQPCCSSSSCSSSNNSPCSSSSSTLCSSLLPPLLSFPSWLKQHVAAQHSSSQLQLQQQLLMAPIVPAVYAGVPPAMRFTTLEVAEGAGTLQGDAAAAAMRDVMRRGDQVWLKPASLDQLAALLQRHCGSKRRARLVAGNTGAGVFKDLWPHDSTVVDLAAVAELHAVTYLKEGVMLGAGLTIQQLVSLLRSPASSSSSYKCSSRHGKCRCHRSSSSSGSGCNSSSDFGSSTGVAADVAVKAAAAGVGNASHCQYAAGHTGCAGSNVNLAGAAAGGGAAPDNTSGVWSAMAEHLERIAGVHVRSAATLGGHFGLCAAKPLPTDLALVLAAAGCWLQVLTVDHAQEPAAAAAAAFAAATGACAWRQQPQQQQQQQQQGLKMAWVTVEEFLEGSCIGAASTNNTNSCSSSGSGDTADFVTAEGVAGGKQLDSHQQQQQHMFAPCCTRVAAPAAEPVRSDGYRIVTAVWLPYGDDSRELFWSYKVAVRHFNSHALVNAAAWFRFQEASTDHSSNSSIHSGRSAAGVGASPFAGSTITSARLFIGFPPDVSAAAAEASAAPAAAVAAAAAGVAQQPDDEATWRVVRLAGAEQQLQGRAVDVQVVMAALRQLEAALTSSGAPSGSFTSQALQGILLKALVPLISPKTLPAAAAAAAASPQTPTNILWSSRSGHTGSISAAAAAAAAAAAPQQKLLRLLQLPGRYDPQQLPQGSQVLPAPPHAAAAAAAEAPVHQPVEKECARLQASGEALFAGDVAARMRGRVLYLASVNSTKALASLQQLDASAALALPGVTGIITAADIPGTNSILGAPLLADGCVEYVGQPVAFLAATSQQLAERAAALVCLTYGPPPAGRKPVITLDDALAAGAFYEDLAPLMQVAAVKPGMGSSSASSSSSIACNASRDADARMMYSIADRAAACGGATVSIHGEVAGSSSSNSSSTRGSLDSARGVPAPDATGRSGSSSSAAACVEQLIAESPRKILGGAYDLPAQQHFYMETQVAVAEPQEDGCLRVTSATQSLDAVQQAVSGVLGLPFNKVAVVTKRLGGGFGGKASRSMPVAAAAALAATLLDAPVCYQLSRCDDFAQNGGRCAGRLQYDVGFREDGKVTAIKAEVLLRAGAYLDLASNDGAQLLAASDSAYDLSGLHVAVKFARCNLPPHTIVRGPGYLQGVMVLEQILEHVAAELQLDPAAVKAANFLPDVGAPTHVAEQQQQQQQGVGLQLADKAAAAAAGATAGSTACTAKDPAALATGVGRLCLGSVAALSLHTQQQQQQQQDDGVRTILGHYVSPETYTLPRVWTELLQGGQGSAGYAEMLDAVQAHNREHAWSKRGIAVTPVRFDCSPAAVSAAISVYADGSVLVTHGGIEMGQGLSTKVKQAAVAALSQLLPEEQRPLPLSLVRLAPSSSEVVPGGGPSWSSTASEGNCQAVMNAAAKVVAQMAPYAQVGKDGPATWEATLAAVCPDVGFAPNAAMLSAYGWFDGSTGSGAAKRPVQYSAFGAALSEVELDVLTGERRVLHSSIMYDCGYPLNPGIDLGQVEGAFVMGLGVMLSEEVQVHPATGKLLSGTTWKYKIPHYDLIPQNFKVSFLSDAPNPRGILSSKASGEPALMASTSALMALQAAAGAAATEIAGLGLATAARPALQLQQNKVASADGSARAGCVVLGVDATEHAGDAQVVGSGGSGKAAAVGWCVLSAPATPQKLKAAVGAFSVADALEAALAACNGWRDGAV